MRTIVTIKSTGIKYETKSEKIKNQWVIGGDFPDYKNCHYIVYSKNIEYSLINGRLKRA